ncbi:MAG: radical SAM protein [Candidatus Electrothrix sp. ATG2]|nr:radical SAM protein [Candidatus Electrothrix sp. ATG2]
MLEFNLLQKITEQTVAHPFYADHEVTFRVVSNGTVFSEEIADFFDEYAIGLGISCDGPPAVQDRFRQFRNGRASSQTVEKNLKQALQWFPLLPVNAVYSAETFRSLPETIDYFCDLGVKNIHLNPNISSDWRVEDGEALGEIYAEIARKYLDLYLQGEPRYISLIDSKIAVILRGGYQAGEKCSMGIGEFAYAPSGNIYPCERLVAGDDGGVHCLGNVRNNFVRPVQCKGQLGVVQNAECQSCALKDYCMNWCGCSNYFASGEYNRVNHLTCASEKAAIRAALGVIEQTGKTGIIDFSDHLAGTPLMSIIGEVSSGRDRNNEVNFL